jgi:hypothetical protein
MDGATLHAGEPRKLDEIHARELAEVYLLINFISGRPGKRLSSLSLDVVEKDRSGNEVVRKLRGAEVIERITALRYSAADTEDKSAQEMAFLLLAKNHLCDIAQPATAQSIAFTDLVVMNPTFEPPLGREQLAEPPSGAQSASDGSSFRVLAAVRAFPDLVPVARNFRQFRTSVTWIAIFLAVTGSFGLAEATYGGQLTSRLLSARQAGVDASTAIYSTYIANHLPGAPAAEATLSRIQDVCPLPPKPTAHPSDEPRFQFASSTFQPAPAGATTLPPWGLETPDANDPDREMKRKNLLGNVDSKFIMLCDEYAYKAALSDNAADDVDAYARSYPVRLFSWLLPIHDLGPPKCPETGEKTGYTQHCGARQETGPSVSGMISALGNYLLPLIFAPFGALAAMIVGIQVKIRNSELIPRDIPLLEMGCLLGCVAGTTVGLFFDPSAVATAITKGNPGLSVSASGIAFLAGYGAPAVFALLDKLLSPVFNFRAKPAPADGPA